MHESESESEVIQSCLTLCNPMDCRLPCSSIHWIFQSRILEWVAISFSRGSSWPRDQTRVSCIVGRCFTIWATRIRCIHVVCLLINQEKKCWHYNLIKGFLSFKNLVLKHLKFYLSLLTEKYKYKIYCASMTFCFKCNLMFYSKSYFKILKDVGI